MRVNLVNTAAPQPHIIPVASDPKNTAKQSQTLDDNDEKSKLGDVWDPTLANRSIDLEI